MNALAAISTGAGIGLAYYGGLWLSLRRAGGVSPLSEPLATGASLGGLTPLARQFGICLTLSRLARLAIAWLGFYALMAEGISFGLAGLVGLLLVRWYLVRHWGGPAFGRS